MGKGKKTNMIECWFDGACGPKNPGGRASYGWVAIVDGERFTGSAIVGSGTGMSNNVSEHAGLAAVLEFLMARGLREREIIIRGDSRLVVEQINGRWRAKRGLYIEQYRRAAWLAGQFPCLRLQWIPREQNAEADALSGGSAYTFHRPGRRRSIRSRSAGEMTRLSRSFIATVRA